MELVPCAAEDITLTQALECDPIVMKELGGPMPKERIPQIHSKRLKKMAEGSCWWFKVVPKTVSDAVGTVVLWDSEYHGKPINEIGWMILPAFQGRGYASAAVRLVLNKAKAEQRFSPLHAFPGITNAASNAICRKAGFVQFEECDIDYAGRSLRCNHWRIDLRDSADAGDGASFNARPGKNCLPEPRLGSFP
ncbi:MAG: GNAT family N-acetyltransferase [Elusimicrobia bacterium]|nr:GNAT family N-acetyltransferase [Elusimicrobiota bacterium]